jgi:hypothetical protein
MAEDSVIDALNDLARIVIACDKTITNQSEAVRRLHFAAVKPARIAQLLAMQTKDVTSLISKSNKKGNGSNGKGGKKGRQRG